MWPQCEVSSFNRQGAKLEKDTPENFKISVMHKSQKFYCQLTVDPSLQSLIASSVLACKSRWHSCCSPISSVIFTAYMHCWDGLWQHFHPNISAHCLPEAVILFNQEDEHEDDSFPHVLSPHLFLKSSLLKSATKPHRYCAHLCLFSWP